MEETYLTWLMFRYFLDFMFSTVFSFSWKIMTIPSCCIKLALTPTHFISTSLQERKVVLNKTSKGKSGNFPTWGGATWSKSCRNVKKVPPLVTPPSQVWDNSLFFLLKSSLMKNNLYALKTIFTTHIYHILI